MSTGNQNEPDSVTVIAKRETNNILTKVNPPNSVFSSGGTENVEVNIPINKQDSVKNASVKAVQNAEARMEKINNRKLDSLMGRKY